jgi:hypothetical protein
MNDDEMSFEKASAKAHVWYWMQLAIWPMIRNTEGCVYCIFLRGAILGGFVALLLGGGAWLIWK